jgi:hypothetical protein
MKVLHRKIKNKKHEMKVLTQKIKDQNQKIMVLHKDKIMKTQDEGITKTKCSKLQEMKLTLEKTLSLI